MKESTSEKEVSALWQRLVRRGVGLLAEDGRLIEVIYPGRPGAGGPDFRDAAIATPGGLRRGDIELHVRATSWEGHGHHLDPAYRGVILHVALWNDTGAATSRHGARRIPLVALGRLTGRDILGGPSAPDCPAARLPADDICQALDRAGDERFNQKATAFRQEMMMSPPEEVLYRGIMGALGYARNQLPFRELARRLPLAELRHLNDGQAPGETALEMLEARLIGAAGLLPSQRSEPAGDEYAEKLEQLWSALGLHVAPGRVSWRLGGVRPANHPVRRLAAMSRLLRRNRSGGLMTVTEKLEGNTGAARDLIALVAVGPEGYWAHHFDFGARIPVTPLIGAGRAGEILANIVLPFAAALGNRRARELFRGLPAPAPNAVARHMGSQLGIVRRRGGSARREQGLLHIYRNCCRAGRCEDCPLNQLQVGDDVQVESADPARRQAEVAAGGHHGSVIGAERRLREEHRER